jgi:hypothetical protein
MEIISRQEAKLLGLDTYFTGKPCKYGHVDYRHTEKGGCLGCEDEHTHLSFQIHHPRFNEVMTDLTLDRPFDLSDIMSPKIQSMLEEMAA